MDLLGIMILILVLAVVIELFKHFLFKGHLLVFHLITKVLFITLIIFVIFLLLISNLKSENALNTDSKVIQTGATIVDRIQERDFFDRTKENLNELKEEIFKKES